MGRAALASVPGLGDTGARARMAAGRRRRLPGGAGWTRAGETAVLPEDEERRRHLPPGPSSAPGGRGSPGSVRDRPRRPAALRWRVLEGGDGRRRRPRSRRARSRSAYGWATRPPASGSSTTPSGSRTRATARSRGSAWRSGASAARRFHVGKNPRAVATGNGSVWVANFGGGTVTRIDARSGPRVQTIPVGPGPIDIAVGRESCLGLDAGGARREIDARCGQVMRPRHRRQGGPALSTSASTACGSRTRTPGRLRSTSSRPE